MLLLPSLQAFTVGYGMVAAKGSGRRNVNPFLINIHTWAWDRNSSLVALVDDQMVGLKTEKDQQLNLLTGVNHHPKYAFIWSARIRSWKYYFTHFWVDGSSHHTMGIRGWALRHFIMEDSYGRKMNLRKIVNRSEAGWSKGNRKAAVFLAISTHKSYE